MRLWLSSIPIKSIFRVSLAGKHKVKWRQSEGFISGFLNIKSCCIQDYSHNILEALGFMLPLLQFVNWKVISAYVHRDLQKSRLMHLNWMLGNAKGHLPKIRSGLDPLLVLCAPCVIKSTSALNCFLSFLKVCCMIVSHKFRTIYLNVCSQTSWVGPLCRNNISIYKLK